MAVTAILIGRANQLVVKPSWRDRLRCLLRGGHHFYFNRELGGLWCYQPAHRHDAVTRHALRQREGIPYEVERVVCLGCRRVLSERTLRRAAA
jgi:hypothetical protein